MARPRPDSGVLKHALRKNFTASKLRYNVAMPTVTTAEISSDRRYTLQEYVSINAESEARLEFHDGQILCMSSGSTAHAAIGFNTIAALGARLRGHRCRGFNADQQIAIPNSPFRFYPDISVICGPVQRDPSDSTGHAVINPTVVIEVLSPGTEWLDRGQKFREYIRLEALQEYVLIAQDIARVETFIRQTDGSWLFAPVAGLDAEVQLRSIGIKLPLGEIYEGIEMQT